MALNICQVSSSSFGGGVWYHRAQFIDATIASAPGVNLPPGTK